MRNRMNGGRRPFREAKELEVVFEPNGWVTMEYNPEGDWPVIEVGFLAPIRLLLFPMEKNKTKASEKQPETHYFTWESFAATIPILEKQVRHKTFTCVYGNSRGGLLLAVLLSYRLGLPLVTTPYASMLWCEDIVDDSETYLRSKRLFPGAVYCAIVTRKYAKDIIHAFDYTKKTALVKFPWEDV